MTYFKNIHDKLRLLESDQPLTELGRGLPSAIGRGIANSLQRTSVGAGKRDLENKANALNKKWLEYRGQTNAVPNKANIEAWVKDKLGMKTQEVWSQAIEEFREQYPKAGQKYIKELPLDKYEVLNFFVKLVQLRLAYIDRNLDQPTQKATAPGETGKDKDNNNNGWGQSPWWKKDKQGHKGYEGTAPLDPNDLTSPKKK